MERELQELEGATVDLKAQNQAFIARSTWISSFNPKASIQENSKKLLFLDQKTIEENFDVHKGLISRFLLKNALERMSNSAEAFFYMKNK